MFVGGVKRIPPSSSHRAERLYSGVHMSGAAGRPLACSLACSLAAPRPILRARLGRLPGRRVRSAGLRLLRRRALLSGGRPLLRRHLLRRGSGVFKIRLRSGGRDGLRRILLQSRNEVRQRLARVHRQRRRGLRQWPVLPGGKLLLRLRLLRPVTAIRSAPTKIFNTVGVSPAKTIRSGAPERSDRRSSRRESMRLETLRPRRTHFAAWTELNRKAV
jgi:hypothetical protein